MSYTETDLKRRLNFGLHTDWCRNETEIWFVETRVCVGASWWSTASATIWSQFCHNARCGVIWFGFWVILSLVLSLSLLSRLHKCLNKWWIKDQKDLLEKVLQQLCLELCKVSLIVTSVTCRLLSSLSSQVSHALDSSANRMMNRQFEMNATVVTTIGHLAVWSMSAPTKDK